MSSFCGFLSFENQPDHNDVFETSFLGFLERSQKYDFRQFGTTILGKKSKTHFGTNKASYLRIVSNSSLTNHTELRQKLGVLASDSLETNDESLILLAFRKWAEKCVEHLNGDFAFAIWDQKQRQLFCARDHLGSSPFFFCTNESGFLFSSEPSGIFEFGLLDRQFNRNKLGTLLFNEPHTYLTGECWFQNINALPAGTAIIVDNQKIKTIEYWQPHKTPVIKFSDEHEVFESFRQLLISTMSSRLSGCDRPASLLSGGLDSSSIVALSAKILNDRSEPLEVYAAVLDPEAKSEYSDELYFIDQFKEVPGVSINYVTADRLGPFSNLSELFDNHDSPFVTSRHYLYRELMASAQQAGARTLFDGSYGEFGATAHSFGGLAEMFAGFNWISLYRELRQRSRKYNESFMYNLRANTISPNIPQFLVDLRRGTDAKTRGSNKDSILTQGFAEELLLDCKYNAAGFDRELPDHTQNQVVALKFLQTKMSEMVSRTIGGIDLELRYPLLDKRIIEFNLSVPLHLKMRDGFYRYLIRASLDGMLPKEIQWRTSKTWFSPDYRKRFRKQIGDVRDQLQEVGKGDPIRELVDVDKLIRWSNFDYFDDSVYQKHELIARDHLPQAMYLIAFMRTFPEFRV